jgi:uncharacterized protein (TIGR00369 family)
MTDDPVALINRMHQGTFGGDLGLVISSATRDGVTAHLVIAQRHRQPHGIVHGGVYCSVVESMASIGAALDAMPRGKNIVGLDNQTSFVRAVREGTLQARATPITRGRRTQLWDVVIENEERAVVATGRVRLLVLDPDADVGGKRLGDDKSE